MEWAVPSPFLLTYHPAHMEGEQEENMAHTYYHDV